MEKIPVRQIHSTPTASNFNRSFSIRELKTLFKGEDMLHNLHRHNFYLLLAIQQGEGLHEIDFVPYPIRDNSIFLIRPGQVHQLFLKAGTTGYLIELNSELAHLFNKHSSSRLDKAGKRSCWSLDANRFNNLQQILASIYLENAERCGYYLDAIMAYLDLYLIELLRQDENLEVQKNVINYYSLQKLEEFKELIEKHVVSHKQVSFYSDLLNLSPYQISEITKTHLGKTPSEVITDYIILEAKRWLLATSAQIKDIAYELGYEDISYFIRFFRKQTGHSPEQFRYSFRSQSASSKQSG